MTERCSLLRCGRCSARVEALTACRAWVFPSGLCCMGCVFAGAGVLGFAALSAYAMNDAVLLALGATLAVTLGIALCCCAGAWRAHRLPPEPPFAAAGLDTDWSWADIDLSRPPQEHIFARDEEH